MPVSLAKAGTTFEMENFSSIPLPYKPFLLRFSTHPKRMEKGK
jgi:hypothetical protein